MQSLTKEEIDLIGGGGNQNGDYEGDYQGNNNTHSGQSTAIGYGGQANGVLGNTAAAGNGLLQSDCSNGVAAGILGGAVTGNLGGFATSVAAGAIGGGCFNDENNSGGNNNSSNNSSSCESGDIGGTCSN